MTNSRIVEAVAVTAMIAPTQQAAGTITTPGHILTMFRKRLYTLSVGAVPAGATVDMKLQASPDGATAWTDLPGSPITTITAAGSMAQIEVAADMVMGFNLGNYLRASITVAGGACFLSLVVQAGDPRYMPASDNAMAALPPAVLI